MAKRIITIILILLIVLGLLLGLSWYMARRSAEKSGAPVPTFREFLGIGGSRSPGEPIVTDNEVGSEFTVGVPSSTPNTTPGGTATSQFTNEPMSPSAVPEPSSTGQGSGSSGQGTSGGTSGTLGGPAVTPSSTPAGPVCSDADLTITFTPDEIARLNALQKRFMTIAQTLYTDADTETELATHDALRAKYDRIAELYSYCEAKAPLIGEPMLKQRVPTPFWKGSSSVINTYFLYINDGQNTNNMLGIPQGGYAGDVNLGDIRYGSYSLDRILRLSLW